MKCKAVICELERRVLRWWPGASKVCPSCLAHMILDGSRMTDDGWKVSLHVLYYSPLVFQHDNAEELS